MQTWVFRGQHGGGGTGEEGTVWENLCLPLSSVVMQERCREMGQVSAGEEGVYPYQLDAVGLYMPEEDITCPLWVPVHVWVIWEIPGRKKCTLETVSNGVQALPSVLVGVCVCGVEGGRASGSVWTTLGLPQLTVACAIQVYSFQSPGYPAGVLSKVVPAFCALPRSKLLRLFLRYFKRAQTLLGMLLGPSPG